jgi:hypothetical protein
VFLDGSKLRDRFTISRDDDLGASLDFIQEFRERGFRFMNIDRSRLVFHLS